VTRRKQKGYYRDERAGSWVVQASRKGPAGQQLRRCQRVRGSEAEARALRQRMLADLEAEVQRLVAEQQRQVQQEQAAAVLGLDMAKLKKQRGSEPRLTLRRFLTERWAAHAAITQNETTRRTTRSHVAYLTLFLGDRPLDEIDAAAVAKVREGLLREGPRSFTFNKAGEPRKTRSTTFTPTAVNRILGTLAAALNLAEREGLIDRAPRVDLLPRDQSEAIVPPSDEQLRTLILAAEDFRAIAPFMPEAIELAAETGMRAGEEFNLTWRSVDFAMGETGAIRIEKQARAKLVGGQPWRPKYKKARVIPLTPRAREILRTLRQRVPAEPDAPVIPSRGGAPYNRLEAAPDKSGRGYFTDVVEAAGLTSHVRWHDLRHYYAVRALLRGVPMAVVSTWLGHADVTLTVGTYGRWASEAREQWQWAKKMSDPAAAIPLRPALVALDGGADERR